MAKTWTACMKDAKKFQLSTYTLSVGLGTKEVESMNGHHTAWPTGDLALWSWVLDDSFAWIEQGTAWSTRVLKNKQTEGHTWANCKALKNNNMRRTEVADKLTRSSWLVSHRDLSRSGYPRPHGKLRRVPPSPPNTTNAIWKKTKAMYLLDSWDRETRIAKADEKNSAGWLS